MPIITTAKGKYRGAEFVLFLIHRGCHFPYFQGTFAKRGKHLCFFSNYLIEKKDFLVINKDETVKNGLFRMRIQKNRKLLAFLGLIFFSTRKGNECPHIFLSVVHFQVDRGLFTVHSFFQFHGASTSAPLTSDLLAVTRYSRSTMYLTHSSRR